ncbi:trace amine-associated receptor 13c-like [Hoplias malabaricus]|uniref:trace amine-associated receptor 13c-like n=1 Tax=Hoplias malabaricus TaxID=27720 RepID=UPI00346277F1
MNITEHQENIVQYCFPDNNSSCRKEVRTGPAYIFLYIVLSFISVCTVVLNLLVIISISHFKQLHTPTNLLILSLAVADLLVGLIVMPVNIMQLIDSCWYLGKLGCYIYPVINFLALSASLSYLIIIAVDRYIAVSDPLLYSTRITVFARRQAKAVRAVTNGLSQNQGDKVSSSSETKAAKTLGIVIFVYLASWIPIYLSSMADENVTSVSLMYTVFAWLMYMNSSVNPLIYAIFYPWFRETTKYIVSCRIFESSSSMINLFSERL